MKNKLIKVIAAVLSLGFILTACGGAGGNGGNGGGSDSDSIIIGGIAPLTGNVAIYGTTATNGAKLAVEEINANGGVLGKQIDYRVEDDKGDITEATNAYNKLADEGMVALLGAITSQPTGAVAEMAVADNMPMITPTGTQFSITEGRPNVFRVCFTDPFQGEMLAQYVNENMQGKKAAIMTNTSSDYSNGVADAFKAKAEELGIEIVAQESYGNTDTDFRAQLTNIAGTNPDVLMIPDYYQIIALIAPQAREVGINATMIGPDGWDGVAKQVDASSIDTVENAVFTNHYSVKDENEKVQNFIKNYTEKYGEEPSAFSALAYDGIYMIKDAIEKAGSTDDKQAIVDGLKGIEFDGVTGHLKFDDNNNPIKSVSMIKIVNGDYTLDSVVAPK
ncbi:MAG: ABC transporter substrate-binding protein [Gallicola sp.]|nr:ABC transporter substrate-binding protein [Gallicola sp.]